MLTLFAIQADDIQNPERAIESFGDIVEKSIILDHRRIDNIPVDTDWYGYIYADEWLDDRIKEALPVFLTAQYFDCLILFKRVVDQGKKRVFSSPRIFKQGVQLKKDMLIPVNSGPLTFEKCLNGWIRGRDGI